MKAAIVGAGAIGGWMAGLLADAGWEVSLFARGTTLARLKAQGLCVRRGRNETTYRFAVSSNPEDLPRPGYVIVAVKGQSVPAVAPAVAALCGSETVVVPALNGVPWWFFQVPGVPLSGTRLESVDPDGAVSGAIAFARVLGCVVHASAWTPEPGVVEVNKTDSLIFGEPDGKTSARCAALCAAFEGSEVRPVASERIRHDIWTKLWGNMSMNPLSVLARAETATLLADPDVRGLIARLMLEMQGLGNRIGLPIGMTPEERMALTARLGSFKTSMLRDAEAGRPLEIDPLLGAVVEIADRLGEDVPFMRGVLGLLRLHAQAIAARSRATGL
jgi:2-dehydropantoate 2-reductase